MNVAYHVLNRAVRRLQVFSEGWVSPNCSALLEYIYYMARGLRGDAGNHIYHIINHANGRLKIYQTLCKTELKRQVGVGEREGVR